MQKLLNKRNLAPMGHVQVANLYKGPTLMASVEEVVERIAGSSPFLCEVSKEVVK